MRFKQRNNQKKRPYCFGRYGGVNCVSISCPYYKECSKIYWGWYEKSHKKDIKLLNKIIFNYIKENNIKLDCKKNKKW